jgi:hypothetical protein
VARSVSPPAAAPPDPISPGGRVAAYATAGSVFATSAVYAAVSWDAFACTRRCAVKPAIGGLVFLVSLTAAVAALALARHIRRRPVDPEGSSGWSFGVGALFALGTFAAIARIPDMTCPAGYHLSAFAYCSGTHDTRLDPTSWIWVKDALAAAALAVAAMLTFVRRRANAAATVAVVVWLIGAAMFLGVVL